VSTLEEGVEFSNDYAPEHLILHLEDSAGCVEKIENAGSVFVGEYSPESYVFLSFPFSTNHISPVCFVATTLLLSSQGVS
jgi:phosphoribosyl-ATP pyrophosphohydrolase/phosphoribosyl-AMP cyclohydrolase/histidinol dehydrogenase